MTVTSTGPGGLELGSLRVPPDTARVAFLIALLALGLAAFATDDRGGSPAVAPARSTRSPASTVACS